MSAHEADGVRRIFGEIGIGEQPAPERPKDIMSNMTGSDFPGHKPHLRIAPREASGPPADLETIHRRVHSPCVPDRRHCAAWLPLRADCAHRARQNCR
jgi:hypothetical protein